MIALATEYGPRVVYSLILLFLSGFFLVEMIRVWSDTRLYLVPFSYERDGAVQTEAGANFARRVSHALRRVQFIYSGGGAPEGLVASTDQIERGLNLELPDVRTSNLESVQVEAYGINFASLLKTIRGWIRANNEVVGFVSHYGANVNVHASIQGQIARLAEPSTGSGLNMGWSVATAIGDLDDVSFDLACGIFRALATSQSEIFRTVGDEDFCQFLRTMDAYQKYKVALSRNIPPAETEKLLALAYQNVQHMGSYQFPFAHKLAGLLFRERQEYTKARSSLSTYIEILGGFGQTDSRIEEIIAELNKLESPTTTASDTGRDFNGAMRARPLMMGVSVSSTKSSAGSLCCFVQNEEGRRFALTSDFNVLGGPGIAVVQPGFFDGGRAPNDEIGRVASVITGEDSEGRIAGALVELTSDVANNIDFRVPISGGRVAGVGKVQPNDEVYLVGRTSGLSRGRITGIAAGTKLVIGPGQVVNFQDMISANRFSQGGDGGAPVFNANNELIGILYAGGGEETYIIPIQPVLDAFKVELLVE